MLKQTTSKIQPVPDARIAIVASRYNQPYVDGMLEAALAVLKKARVRDVEVFRVPGAYEIPVIAATLASRKQGRPEGILCFGLIWQGETTHAQHIGEAVSMALMNLAVETGVTVVHQVLSVATEEQAVARCLTAKTNRGTEAAHTALAMVPALRLAANSTE